VWVLFFTAGGIVNCAYCLWLMVRRGAVREYFGTETARNLRLAALMSVLWIASFYLFGGGSGSLGSWGLVAGWPAFISLSIAIGVVLGLRRGEWEGAPQRAKAPRNLGLGVLLVAVVIIALSNAV
jgi:hypothetical protein